MMHWSHPLTTISQKKLSRPQNVGVTHRPLFPPDHPISVQHDTLSYTKLTIYLISIAASGALNDDIGSQDYIENMLKMKGLNPNLLQQQYFDDGVSDMDNEEFIDEPQSQWKVVYPRSSPIPDPIPGVSNDCERIIVLSLTMNNLSFR